MKIAVVGTGYVGLVAGACFAETGNDVVCVDKDAAKVRTLRKGRMPIFEPGLEELVRRNVAEKRLSFTTLLPKAVRASSVVFIAVGTPQGEDGVGRSAARPRRGARDRAGDERVQGHRRQEHGAGGHGRKVREIVRRETTHPFSVVSNPEFLKQGAAVDDFLKPDRVVIGAGGREGRRDHAAALRAVHAHGRADHGDGHGQRRAVQVRRERPAGDAASRS